MAPNHSLTLRFCGFAPLRLQKNAQVISSRCPSAMPCRNSRDSALNANGVYVDSPAKRSEAKPWVSRVQKLSEQPARFPNRARSSPTTASRAASLNRPNARAKKPTVSSKICSPRTPSKPKKRFTENRFQSKVPPHQESQPNPPRSIPAKLLRQPILK